MSWLKSAMNKALGAGDNNSLTDAVKSYADSVVQQAGHTVSQGAKIFQGRIGARSYRSVRLTIKSLEDSSISCRGSERVMLLRRWLVMLKEVKEFFGDSFVETQTELDQRQFPDEHCKKHMVMHFDPEDGGEPINFEDVFLRSQALEGVTLSMILEAPNDEEISLLLEIFRLCLCGDKEVHIALVSSIQDLATAFANYHDEVLVKREELLQFVQGAVTGLKVNPELVRIEAEAMSLKNTIGPISASFSGEAHVEIKKVTSDVLKEAIACVGQYSKLEELLLKKSHMNLGDSPDVHAQKVDKLKVLSTSLESSMSKADKRIIDHRQQKEEALKARISKYDETREREMEIEKEINALEKERDELEAELKRVSISLAAANTRLQNVREEKDQIDAANDQIIEHLKTKEDDLSRSITACKAEAKVLYSWINFLEDTWALQCSCKEIKEKQIDDELMRHEAGFANFVFSLLRLHKSELEQFISCIRKVFKNLNNLNDKSMAGSRSNNEYFEVKKNLEDEYFNCESKVLTAFSAVDSIREKFHSNKHEIRIKELFDDIGKLRVEFDLLKKSNPDMEAMIHMAPKIEPVERGYATEVEKEQEIDHAAELAKLESEFGKLDQPCPTEDIQEWEFDELERRLRSHDEQ